MRRKEKYENIELRRSFPDRQERIRVEEFGVASRNKDPKTK